MKVVDVPSRTRLPALLLNPDAPARDSSCPTPMLHQAPCVWDHRGDLPVRQDRGESGGEENLDELDRDCGVVNLLASRLR